MKKYFILSLTAAALLFSSCKKDEAKPGPRIFKGPEVTFQHGKAFTWYETDGNDKPLKIAVNINDAAWNSLSPGGHGGGHQHNDHAELKFHPKVDANLFNHVGLGWNPDGHEPHFIYGLPHFDFHFYNVSPAEVAAIPPYDVDSTGFLNLPAAAYLPPTYFYAGGGVPQMGTHWLDFTSSELNGSAFTQTFIYGTYAGKVTFMEPMITRTFIEQNPTFTRSIPQPAKVQKTGYYPTKLRFARNADSRDFIMEDFVYRTAE
jgi:hypothetical protein